MKISLHTIVCAVFVLISLSRCWALTIIEEGKARCVIVMPSNAKIQEKSAAKDLQTYLEKISGARPGIVREGPELTEIPIYIGASNAATNQGLFDRVKKLKDDGYIIKVTSKALYIIGKDPLAIRFAVFGLLEDHLGVRWYMPSDIGEVVPHFEDVVLKQGTEVKQPSFRMRWIGSGDWALRNRMNVHVDSEFGLHVYNACHTFHALCPVEKYFDDHPDYFALVNGERKRYMGRHRNQLCTSNPEVIQVVVENACKIFEDKPELDVMTIFPNDGLGFCECDKCRALDENKGISVRDINKKHRPLGSEKYSVLSRRMAIFYNEVAKGILSKYPGRYVQVGAYRAYRYPPENLNIKAPKHTIVEITRNNCHDLPIECGSCNTLFSETVDGWEKIFPLFSIYEYYWKMSANELPYPIIHSIRKDIPYYYKKGCLGLCTQYSPKNVGTLGLNYYIAAKLLWDVNADVDEILDDFYRKFYGPAWKAMQAYYETLENAVIVGAIHLPAKYDELPLIFSKDVLVNCNLFLSQARAKAQENEKVSKRINMAQISFGNVELAMDYINSLKGASQKLGWFSKEMEKSRDLARKILAYLEEHKSSNCFKMPVTSYVKRFLNAESAIRRIARFRDKVRLNKKMWLKQKKNFTTKKRRSLNRFFDIWIYGYDFDRGKSKAEHEVYLIAKKGREVRVGEVPTREGGGNRKDRCFVIKGLDSQNFIHSSDTVELHIVNPKGGWTASRIYGVYIMPNEPRRGSKEATNMIENDLAKLHEESFGFVEYSYRGVANNDGQTLKLSLSL